MESRRLTEEHQQLQTEQYQLLSEYPYSKVTYFVEDDDGNVIDIMKVSELDNVYETVSELIDLLNKQRNIIAGLKVTRRRMRSDIRSKDKEISKLKMEKYQQFSEEKL